MNKQMTAGLLLLTLAMLWFLTPAPTVVLSWLGLSRSYGTNPTESTSLYDIVNMTLNILNTVFAASGVFLAVLGLRAQGKKEDPTAPPPSDKVTTEGE